MVMRMSSLFLRTLREDPADAELPGHKLLVRAGYVRRAAPGVYTFWDYQAGAWPKNNGIRIDHLLLSPQAADRLGAVSIAKHVRGWDKASDEPPPPLPDDIVEQTRARYVEAYERLTGRTFGG